jgi:hypothetical protein
MIQTRHAVDVYVSEEDRDGTMQPGVEMFLSSAFMRLCVYGGGLFYVAAFVWFLPRYLAGFEV